MAGSCPESLRKGVQQEIKNPQNEKGYYRLNVYSKDIYSELLEFRKNPETILHQPMEFQIGFLQGVFDAEGSVRKGRNHITVSLNRKDTIDVIQKLLSRIGIETGKHWQDKNLVITIPIYGSENMKKFHSLLDFRHPDKSERLKLLVND